MSHNKPILIGSKALKRHIPSFPRGESSDLDLVMAEEGRKRGDSHISPEVYNALLPYCEDIGEFLLPSLGALYTLKVSHIFWKSPAIYWRKHMNDLIFLQRAGYDTFFPSLFKKLYEFWEVKKGKKPAYLNVPNEKFFTSAVPRKYVHDDIHEVMAYYEEPLYKRLKKDTSKALISKEMFDALPDFNKMRLVREEAYVTALERFIIPSNFTDDPQKAYIKSLNLLITSMCKGFFPLYIVLNYSKLLELDIDFVQKFKKGESKCRLVNH